MQGSKQAFMPSPAGGSHATRSAGPGHPLLARQPIIQMAGRQIREHLVAIADKLQIIPLRLFLDFVPQG